METGVQPSSADLLRKDIIDELVQHRESSVIREKSRRIYISLFASFTYEH